MEYFIGLIGNSAVIQFLSTFGLATLLVLYFVLIRDPKIQKRRDERDREQAKHWEERDKKWVELLQEKYDQLVKDYGELATSYFKLEQSLDPQKREMSSSQAQKLCNIALDRDLYKLKHYFCQMIDGDREPIIDESFRDTVMESKALWNEFNPPFPKVNHIDELYEPYVTNGQTIKAKIQPILECNASPEEKKGSIWKTLVEDTVSMKNEFEEDLRKIKDGEVVNKWGFVNDK
jgi:hypothetical protein